MSLQCHWGCPSLGFWTTKYLADSKLREWGLQHVGIWQAGRVNRKMPLSCTDGHVWSSIFCSYLSLHGNNSDNCFFNPSLASPPTSRMCNTKGLLYTFKMYSKACTHSFIQAATYLRSTTKNLTLLAIIHRQSEFALGSFHMSSCQYFMNKRSTVTTDSCAQVHFITYCLLIIIWANVTINWGILQVILPSLTVKCKNSQMPHFH